MVLAPAYINSENALVIVSTAAIPSTVPAVVVVVVASPAAVSPIIVATPAVIIAVPIVVVVVATVVAAIVTVIAMRPVSWHPVTVVVIACNPEIARARAGRLVILRRDDGSASTTEAKVDSCLSMGNHGSSAQESSKNEGEKHSIEFHLETSFGFAPICLCVLEPGAPRKLHVLFVIFRVLSLT